MLKKLRTFLAFGGWDFRKIFYERME